MTEFGGAEILLERAEKAVFTRFTHCNSILIWKSRKIVERFVVVPYTMKVNRLMPSLGPKWVVLVKSSRGSGIVLQENGQQFDALSLSDITTKSLSYI